MTPRSSSRSIRRFLVPALASAAVLGAAAPATAWATSTTTATTTVAAAATSTATSAAATSKGWGSLPKSGGSALGPEGWLTDLRAGRHADFDRLVVDLGGPATKNVHWSVRYVDQVTHDGSGAVVPIRGGARLQISVGADTHSPVRHLNTYAGRNRVDAVDVSRFSTFRQVRFISDFEGVSTVGLGVRGRLPYRVFVIPAPASSEDSVRLVIDVKHHW